jgi:H+/gluconate symporter-like permease
MSKSPKRYDISPHVSPQSLLPVFVSLIVFWYGYFTKEMGERTPDDVCNFILFVPLEYWRMLYAVFSAIWVVILGACLYKWRGKKLPLETLDYEREPAAIAFYHLVVSFVPVLVLGLSTVFFALLTGLVFSLPYWKILLGLLFNIIPFMLIYFLLIIPFVEKGKKLIQQNLEKEAEKQEVVQWEKP